MNYIRLSLFFLLLLTGFSCQQKVKRYAYVDLSNFEDGIHHWELYSSVRSTERLDTTDIIGIADQLINYQNKDGGWPKNIDWLTCIPYNSVQNGLSKRYRQSTFDNRNIWPQIEYLSAVYLQSNNEKYKKAAERGFQYILHTEHPNGGWRGWDADVITFNDDVMTGIMELLLDVKMRHEKYSWLNAEMQTKLVNAYNRGLQVIIDCQISINGVKTAWCQQHSFETHLPVQGRAYEYASVTARESCDIILFLMRIEKPDSAIRIAIQYAVTWLNTAKIEGYRYTTFSIEEKPYHETTINFDREFVPDSAAQPVWARYYDLQNGEPFLSLRNGTIVYNLKDISFDRRVGYEWYGFWPKKVLKEYAEWELENSN